MNSSKFQKAIILAGGSGSRLYPVTLSVSKQLLPIYNKPTIYYSISMVMLLGIKEIAIIVTPEHENAYKNLLGDGGSWGLKICYISQSKPRGIADAIKLSATFIGEDDFMFLLGDNLFFGHDLINKILTNITDNEGLILTTYSVKRPSDFGIAQYGDTNKIIHIVEKPKIPTSNRAVTGLYFYPNLAVELANTLTPSDRGELEITDLNNLLLTEVQVSEIKLGRGDVWYDTGNCDELHNASMFVKAMEDRSGQLIGSIDEISYRLGWVTKQMFKLNIERVAKSNYGKSLQNLIT